MWRSHGEVNHDGAEVKGMKPFTAIATVIFSLIAVAQMLRFLFRVEVMANGISIPLWPSAVAAVFFGGLAYKLWRENHPHQ